MNQLEEKDRSSEEAGFRGEALSALELEMEKAAELKSERDSAWESDSGIGKKYYYRLNKRLKRLELLCVGIVVIGLLNFGVQLHQWLGNPLNSSGSNASTSVSLNSGTETSTGTGADTNTTYGTGLTSDQTASAKAKSNATSDLGRHTLPDTLTDARLNQLAALIRSYYNQKDYDSLYQMLGADEKKELKKADFNSSMGSFKAFGKLQQSAYSQTQYIKTEGGASYFMVYYNAIFDAGSGQVQMILKTLGDQWEIMGFQFDIMK